MSQAGQVARPLIVFLVLLLGDAAFSPAGGETQAKELTFEEVHKNPAAYKGKKIAWHGKFAGLLNSRVTFFGNYDSKGAGKAEPWKMFVVDFPNGKDALKAVRGGKVIGTVDGEVTMLAQVFKGKPAEQVKAPLIKLLSFEPNKQK